MKTTLKILAVLLVVVIAGVIAGVMYKGGALIKGAVNTYGPGVLGVPVTLESAQFMPVRGKIQLTKLHVGNPEGFKTPGLFDLGDIDIELDARSLFSDTVVIHKVFVNAPVITYERGLLDSNISKLTEQLQGGKAKPAEEKKPAAAQKEGGGKKVVIEHLLVRDAKLNFSVTASFGQSIPIALGQIELSDIGRKNNGVTYAEAVVIIFSALTKNIENAVVGAKDLIGSGVKAVGSGAAAVGGTAVDGASSAVKGIGDLLGIGGKKEEPKGK